MIYFGTSVGYPEKLKDICAPGIAYSMGGENYVHDARPSNGSSIFTTYAEILKAAYLGGAEALVLLHDDLELRDPHFPEKVRALLADETIAVAGLIGSSGAKGLAWWEGKRVGMVEDAYAGVHDFHPEVWPADVEQLDGMCLILSRWAIENLVLEGLGYDGFHGYDGELCQQARKAGKRVVVTNIDAFHHSKGGYVGGREMWDRSESVYATRWLAKPVDPWAMVKGPPAEWDIELMFTMARGAPVSERPHVMLATPAYTPPCLEFLNARELVMDDLVKNGVTCTVVTSPGDSLVMRGRHSLMHEFLKSSATHLVFWDADIAPLDPTIVRQMLATGHAIVGGACPFRGDTGNVVCNITQRDKDRKRVDTDGVGCVAVNEVGTGFLLMSRVAIVKMCESHPELLYFADLLSSHGEPMWALFDTVIKNQRFLSEDYFFCALWRNSGGKVYVYVPFEAEHWGRKGYRASFMGALGMRAP